MRVNSAFSAFFTDRLVVMARIAVVLAIFVIASSFIEHSDRDLRAKQVNLLIRQTGHRLLLQAGDSTSRVLPVTEIREGTFLLRFSEVVSLTDKECKVLNLLHQNFGELIPRETLMQEVWINDGVIIGRSLDMFVAKLRKKLSRDPELRITNVHGKGR
jgi:DNA-binding response OmpR family regulator